MKTILAICAIFAASTVFASKAYQVTGPVLEITDSTITVDKKGEKFEIEKTATTQLPADVKVGDKVTVFYKMSADSVEAKASATKEKKEKKAKK